MEETISLRKCISFVECQLRETKDLNLKQSAPFITISRETGAGGHAIANKLIQSFNKTNSRLKGPWNLFDRDLVDTVLEEHNLPKRLAAYMPENKVNELNSSIEEILGLHPSHWTLLGATAETIYNLARLGRVILIGRASHIITRLLPYGIHIRLISSEEKRIQYIMDAAHFTQAEAKKHMQKEDRSRYDYLKNYYNQDINDPASYDLVINTSRVNMDRSVKLIETMLEERVA